MFSDRSSEKSQWRFVSPGCVDSSDYFPFQPLCGSPIYFRDAGSVLQFLSKKEFPQILSRRTSSNSGKWIDRMNVVKQIDRKDLKPGEVLCDYCTAKCCRYFALPLDTPEDWEDFDHIRWYMAHGRISVFVEDGVWYLMVHGDCQYLQDDNLCGIYQDRPQICRDYTTDDCEYEDDSCYEQFFEDPAQVWEYAEAILPPRKKNKKAKGLPVLSGVS